VFTRRPAKRPQRILQSFRQRHEALAAEHDIGVLEAGIGKPEMVEPVIELLARNGNAETGHVGEVRKAEAAGLMRLSEDDLLFLAVDGPPGADAPLQRAANPAAQFGRTRRPVDRPAFSPRARSVPDTARRESTP
jgi:hypothetical protein